MRLDTLSIACSLALAALAGQASAALPKCGDAGYDPYACDADAGYDMVYLTGATAPDNFLETSVTNWLEAGFTKIIDNVDGAQYRAFVGKLKSVAPVPAAHQGKSIRFIKRSEGGSVWGVNPVARDEFVKFLDVKNTTAGCSTSGSPRTCNVIGTDGVSGLKPIFGVSDVNPEMFKSPYNVEFDKVAGHPVDQLSPAETSGLTIKAANTLMMGIVATNSVPTSTYISRSIYNDLLRSGGYADWTQVDAGITPTAGTQLVVCRRVPGSGTQTSYNWFFHHFPCTLGSQVGDDFLFPKRMADSFGYDPDGDGNRGLPGEDGSAQGAKAFTLDPTLGLTVIENSTSGNVRTCLEKAQNGGVHQFQDEEGKWVKVDFGSGGYGAIGVLSVDSFDNRPKSPAAPDACNATTGQTVCGWSYRFLDGAGSFFDSNAASGVTATSSAGATGIAPSKQNLIDGKYDFAAELTFQYKTTKLAGLPTTKSFVDALITALSAPAGNTQPWVAALPPQPFAGGNTAKATRGGNMCAPLQFFY